MARLRLVPLLAAFAWLLLTSPPAAYARSDIEPVSPCDAARSSTLVFVGTVTGGESVGANLHDAYVRYRFRVDERLKGTPGALVHLNEPLRHGRRFRTGQPYLVYSDGISTDAFGRTGPLDARLDDVEVLRAMRVGMVSPRIFGKVLRWTITPDGARLFAIDPVRGVRVVAKRTTRGTATGRRWEVVTDVLGRFRFLDLDPGQYRVEPVFSPAGIHREDTPSTVELATCAAETVFLATPELLRGRATTSRGEGVAEGIPLTVIPADASSPWPDLRRSVSTLTRADGSWSFKGLPPGRYRLGVNVVEPGASTNPYPQWWHPGTSDVRDAQVIEVTEGRVRYLDLGLPLLPPMSRLTGRVVRPSGRPALRSTVWLHEVGRPAHDPRRAETDVEGHFAIEVPAGRRFWVYASDDWPGEVRSNQVLVDPGRPLHLTLTQPAIGQRGLPEGW